MKNVDLEALNLENVSLLSFFVFEILSCKNVDLIYRIIIKVKEHQSKAP